MAELSLRAAIDAAPWRSPSALALLAANLLPLYGVLAWDWPVFPLLLLFWFENVMLGLLNALRMLLADPENLGSWLSKLLMIPFFCVHYGMFTAGHGVFVFAFFGGKEYESLSQGLWVLKPAARAAAEFNLWLPLAALAGSHLFSFAWNYVLKGEYREARVENLMMKPYARVIVLHVTVLFGGFGAMALGSPLWALLLLIALKIGLDLAAHLKEHRAAQAPADG